ncbi:MAG: GTPase Era [Cyclobacteriaceae bacterium]
MENTIPSNHKAGFVSIVGKPNVGKSSLMNRLTGENLSIITSKAQTTRHRIMGMLNSPEFQIVYSDTPGILEPKYELHKAMMNYVKVSLEDADVILLVVEWGESFDEKLFQPLKKATAPIILLINKSDLGDLKEEEKKIKTWKEKTGAVQVLTVSAKTEYHLDLVVPALIQLLPFHPPYFPKDEFTTRSERFFAAEIIREKIFLNYKQEIPYSCEVGIESFKEEEKIIRIRAIIFVERDSQKGILIGKAGSSLKTVGMEARKDMESFFAKQIFLETTVKVAADWRKESNRLKQFGYFD